jgi:endonuclease/exonuclease/phosphatase family metal-dependent hydrolase
MKESQALRWRVAVTGLAAAAVVVAVAPGATSSAPRPVSAVTMDVGVYNVYLGADLTPLFGATSLPDFGARAEAIYAEMVRTDFPQRAEAIAELVAEERPDVLGLNEVARWETAPMTLVPTPGGPVPVVTGPYTTTYDFERILLDALAAAGEPYTVVAKNTNFTSAAIPIPIPISPTLAGRFTDHDLILVRIDALKHISVSNPRSFNFSVGSSFSVTLFGLPIVVERGWSTVDLTQWARTYRFVNTHLEAFGSTPLRDEWRNRQAAELVADLETSPHPVVVVGDINARPTLCQDFREPPQFQDRNVVAYGLLEDAGLQEVWPLVFQKAPCGQAGWTSGQRSSLLAPSTLDHRIDVVFVSEAFSALQAETIGEEPDDRTEPSGFWPSDHAGSLAKIRLDALS